MSPSRAAACALFLAAAGAVVAADPPCEPGYRWAEELRCKDVERLVCKVVPDVKKVKKVVYATKDDPFCLPAAKPLLGHQADCDCAGCRGPFARKILVKTEITCVEPTTKCVVEKVVERVEYRVKVKVPCGPAAGPY